MDSEVVFNTGAHDEDHEDHEDQEKTPDSRIPPTPITQRDIDTIIRGWEEKFSRIVNACARCSSPPRELARTCASWGKKRERRVKNTIGACRTSYKSLRISTP